MENNVRIPRSEILKLYESSLRDLSPHSIGQWLKSITKGEYMVIPKVAMVGFYNMTDNFEATASLAIAEFQGIKEEILDEWVK